MTPLGHDVFVCDLGELNSNARARWLKTLEVFNEPGEAQPLKLFPADVEPPADDPQVARVPVGRVHRERTRPFGACGLGMVEASGAGGLLPAGPGPRIRLRCPGP